MKRIVNNKRNIAVILLAVLLPGFILGQKKTKCKKVKTGNFYFYPAKSSNTFLISRNDSLQKEINLQTMDTSFWKLEWKTPCSFTLTFLKKTGKVSEEERTFLKSNRTVIEILEITKDYYVFKGWLDNVTAPSITDTLWMKKKI